jgi:predicted RNA methylase
VVVGDFNNDGKPDVVVIDPPYGREPSNHSCNFLQITLFNYRCGSGPA